MEDKVKTEVVTTQDDIDNMENFFKHFGEPMPNYLRKQIDNWKENKDNYTWQAQEELRAALSHALLSCKHDIMSNDVWNGIRQNCDDTFYNAQFDKDLEEILAEEG